MTEQDTSRSKQAKQTKPSQPENSSQDKPAFMLLAVHYMQRLLQDEAHSEYVAEPERFVG